MKLILLLLVVLATGDVGRIIRSPHVTTEDVDSSSGSDGASRIPVLRNYVEEWKHLPSRLPHPRPPANGRAKANAPANVRPHLASSNDEDVEIIGYDQVQRKPIPAFRIPRVRGSEGVVQSGCAPSVPHRATHHSEHLESVPEHLQVHNSPPTPVEIPAFPWNVVYLMTVQFGDNLYRCTGWAIDDFHIATAGHCAYDFTDGWAKQIILYPSVGGQAAWGVAETTKLWVESAYEKSADWENANHWDIAWARINWKIASRTGWMARSSSLNISDELNYPGYPYDGPYFGNNDLILSQAHMLQNDDPLQFYTTGESWGGNSGGPIYSYHKNRTIVGLLSGGTSGQETDRPYSFWTRLTDDRLNVFDSQIKNDSTSQPADQPELIEAIGALYKQEPFNKLSPTVVSPGDNCTFQFGISNIGFKTSAPIRITFIISNNPTGNDSFVTLGTQDADPLDPNTFDTYSQGLQIPSNLAPGTYYILAVFSQDVEYTPYDSFAFSQINITNTPTGDCSEHKCSNNQCIPNAFVCDGNPDCSDGGDENNCTCDSSQFTCLNKKCLPQSSHCDGMNDCGDFSDEINCTCSFDEFQCGSSQQCVPKVLVCDGNRDCPNGEDEDSSHCACPSNSTACASVPSICVLNTYKCDYYFDCPDHSDEQNCDCTGAFQCGNGGCIPPSWKCDGYNDCGDWSDEANCKCPKNSSRCEDPPICVSRNFFCDGVNDCGLGDENNCTSSICGDGKSIPQQFVCDGVKDCKDGADEDNCGNSGNSNGAIGGKNAAMHVTYLAIILALAFLKS
jgi:V8-like Glu-specific endopeptidase